MVFSEKTTAKGNVKVKKSPYFLTLAVFSIIGIIVILFAYSYTTGQISSILYHKTGNLKWMYSALHQGVKKGDSRKKVDGLIGPGKKASSEILDGILGLYKKFPENYPDGIEERDIFMDYAPPGGMISFQFQFRDGGLVNFDPKSFANYEEMALTR